jgi:C_GCAxxG_C_C family probable redox protein
MDIDEIEQKAMDFKAIGFNCCEAVVKAFEEYLNSDILSACKGFGQGMATLEATCGSLIGANMVLGNISLNYSRLYTKSLFNKFKDMSKATICKELKGIDTKVVLTPCPLCVKNACRALFEVIKENNIIKE